MHDNRRSDPRYDIALAAEINTGSELHSAQAKNLSRGGVGLALAQGLPDNALIGISLFILEDGIEDATSATLDVQGQVIWVAQTDGGSFEVGVRFAPLPPNQVRLLDHFLGRLAVA
jgi:c-di-GMP-binding flagellar brake protein YcgR